MPDKPAPRHHIFSKPLRELLDDLDKATAYARKAAEDVMKRLQKLFMAMVKDITEELGETKK